MFENKGKVAIVTGGNCGLGYCATEMLCKAGVEVIIACRTEAKAKEAVVNVKKGNPDANVDFMLLDLASLKSVKSFADEFLATDKPLHILVNNAGLYNYQGPREETSDGFELHMGTNHIGHFLLTSLLLEKLKETGTAENKARIVVVGSMLHNGKSKGHRVEVADIDYDDLHLTREGVFSGPQAYKNSKAANVMFTLKLARQLKESNVTVNVLCPGFIPSTNLGRESSWFTKFMLRWVLDGLMKPFVGVTRSAEHGAGLMTQLAVDPKHEGETGSYYSDYKSLQSSEESLNEESQEKLWEVTKREILSNNRFPSLSLMD